MRTMVTSGCETARVGRVEQFHDLEVERADRQRMGQQGVDIGRIGGEERGNAVELGADRGFLVAQNAGMFAIGGGSLQAIEHQVAQAHDARPVAVHEALDGRMRRGLRQPFIGQNRRPGGRLGQVRQIRARALRTGLRQRADVERLRDQAGKRAASKLTLVSVVNHAWGVKASTRASRAPAAARRIGETPCITRSRMSCMSATCALLPQTRPLPHNHPCSIVRTARNTWDSPGEADFRGPA
jgi:hypothetical protein